jgi:hypothetical protein
MKFNFHFGKPSKKSIIITSVVTSTIIAVLSQCSKIHENNLWDLLDEIQRKYFPQTTINRVIIQDPDKLNRRVERDVDKAIRLATPEYDRIIQEADQKYKEKYLEKPIDENVCYTDECKSLGGEIRICAPWVEDCK